MVNDQDDDVLISSMPTPFDREGRVDLDIAVRLARRTLDGGAHKLLLAGTMGEFLALTPGELYNMATRILEEVGPDRLIVHIGGASAHQACNLARKVISLGVTSIAAITPFFTPNTPETVCDYYKAIRDASSGVSLLAYHYPEYTRAQLTSSELARIVADAQLDGAKLSCLGLTFLTQLVRESPPAVKIYSGDLSVSQVREAGGTGVISGNLSAFPHLYREVFDALRKGDGERESTYQSQLDVIADTLGPNIAYLKYALTRLQILENHFCRMAVEQPDNEASSKIDLIIERYGA